MRRQTPSISTDQVRAFVELVEFGNLRLAAKALHLSEEGLRGRLLMLEERLGVSLYEKERGRRTSVNLTHAGKVFHAKAIQFLENAQTLTALFEPEQASRDIRIGVSYYIANFYLGNILKLFCSHFPAINVQISTGTEQQIISTMQADATIMAGICVPDEFPKNLRYSHLLSMTWRFIAPLNHPLLDKSSVSLEDLARVPLIMFEPPCSGRQRILEVFYAANLVPRIILEVTTTQMILSLVEQGMGGAIIPVLRSSTILNGRRIGQVPISDPIRPVEYGILSREAIVEDHACNELVNFILAQFADERLSEIRAVKANSRLDIPSQDPPTKQHVPYLISVPR